MTDSVNELLLNSSINHSHDLENYKNHVVAKNVALLNRTDDDLFAQLARALEKLDPDQFTVQRLEKLLDSVKELNAQAYQQIGKELTDELKDFTSYELGYQKQLFESVIPAQVLADVRIVGVAANQVYAAAMARPFQGRLLKEWGKSLETTRMIRIRDEIRMGYIENQTVSQIVKRIRGTKANGYKDGVIEIDRRHAESVVRTAVSHTAAYAKEQLYKANKDILKCEVWTATLDNRTTKEICVPRDGKKYEIGTHKPIGHNYTWMGGAGAAHWNCRSVMVPVTKSWKELSGVDIGEFSPQTRASMSGQVPAEMTYSQWFAKQSAARQDEILGPTRAKLYRDGGLELEAFSNNRGVLYDLPTLKQRDSEAFKKAGL